MSKANGFLAVRVLVALAAVFAFMFWAAAQYSGGGARQAPGPAFKNYLVVWNSSSNVWLGGESGAAAGVAAIDAGASHGVALHEDGSVNDMDAQNHKDDAILYYYGGELYRGDEMGNIAIGYSFTHAWGPLLACVGFGLGEIYNPDTFWPIPATRAALASWYYNGIGMSNWFLDWQTGDVIYPLGGHAWW